MTRVPLLPALLLGATLAAASSAAANPLNNRAWWTSALQGVQTPPSNAVSALPAAITPVSAPGMMPSAGLAQPFAGAAGLSQGFGGQGFNGRAPASRGPDVGYDLCLGPIYKAERDNNIPIHLLRSIALAESGRWDETSRSTVAWPWTINAEGVGHFFQSKAAAIAFARQLQSRGIRSMDIGCMQVNLVWHPGAFASLEEAFEPERNVAYAARHLADLKADRKTWTEAVGYYHSATPELGQRYRAKVMKLWAEIQRNPESTQMASAAADSGRAMPMGFAPPAAGNISPNWMSGDAKPGASGPTKVAAMSAAASPTEGRRGMKLDQYRMAPTLQALELPKTSVYGR